MQFSPAFLAAQHPYRAKKSNSPPRAAYAQLEIIQEPRAVIVCVKST